VTRAHIHGDHYPSALAFDESIEAIDAQHPYALGRRWHGPTISQRLHVTPDRHMTELNAKGT
jgi:hypothetical protein